MKGVAICEESQEVAKAFRAKGHEFYSCDILPCSGGHPEWHFQDDAFEIMKRGWDIIISFPPCTHLTVSGNSSREEKRRDGRLQQGIDFFLKIAKFGKQYAKLSAMENPIGIMSTLYRKPDQYIHPWQFGHMEQKKTCLWLEGLPPLFETNNVYKRMMQLPRNQRERLHYLPPGENRAKLRSRTFSGIAKAMADQWGVGR